MKSSTLLPVPQGRIVLVQIISAKCLSNLLFENFQGWTFQNLSRLLVLMLDKPQSQKVIPNLQPKILPLQIKSIALITVPYRLREKSPSPVRTLQVLKIIKSPLRLF